MHSENPKLNSLPSVLIPAFCPDNRLVEIVRRLLSQNLRCVIVDDGSSPVFSSIFEELRQMDRVMVLRHAVNLGKGAALKTGINWVLLSQFAEAGVVTADADGQHQTDDILNVCRALAENPGALILGARSFEGEVPFRSRLGNSVTSLVFWFFTGKRLTDTQTGLRGIPHHFCKSLLRLKSTGYDFELDMLMAAHREALNWVKIPIKTVYEPMNKTSHFNPLFDSLRIYFVFLRFISASIITATLDYLVFFIVFEKTGTIAVSTMTARIVATSLSFVLSRSLVFRSKGAWLLKFVYFCFLVSLFGFLSVIMIKTFSHFGIPVLLAKAIAEGILFLGSFFIQREIVFRRSDQ